MRITNLVEQVYSGITFLFILLFISIFAVSGEQPMQGQTSNTDNAHTIDTQQTIEPMPMLFMWVGRKTKQAYTGDTLFEYEKKHLTNKR